LRAELAGSGVTVSLVLPGSTRTPFFERAKSVVPGLEPKPLGLVQPAEKVAEKIVRTVDRPRPEVDAIPILRPAWVLAEAFPFLPDLAGRWYYSRVAARLGLDSAPAPSEDAASRTTGTH
jgi:short-subunit dehydrogenase